MFQPNLEVTECLVHIGIIQFTARLTIRAGSRQRFVCACSIQLLQPWAGPQDQRTLVGWEPDHISPIRLWQVREILLAIGHVDDAKFAIIGG